MIDADDGRMTKGGRDSLAEPPEPETAREQRAQVTRPNRNIAILLISVALVFLAGAFGVALLVSYASF